ncbi:MFS transporter [Micromonospora sp. Llam7]|nr:MFS transporter [Micromonospora tarapacensis]
MRIERPRGMAAFVVIWLGQLLSAAGTRMINFALAIWVWQQTGRASDLALLTLMAFAATVVVSPMVGSLVDRIGQRTSIIVSDVGSVLTTVAALVLFATGAASFWPLVAVNTISGAFLAFQYPAYAKLITLLLVKEQYTRANGMLSLVRSVPAIFAPGIAGLLIAYSGIWSVLLVALASFGIAIVTVLLIALPKRPEIQADPGGSRFWKDSILGFRYLFRRAGFLGMQAILFVVGLVSAMGFIVLTPLVLIKADNNEALLGAINSIGAVGGALGALLVSVLRPPSRKIWWILGASIVFSLFGRVLMGFGDGLVLWAIAWFVSWMSVPFVEAYSLTIWQQKIPPAVQGRVFAAMQFISQLALLIGFSVTGALIDRVFEPQAREGYGLVALFEPVVGTGPGAGMKLVFLLSGLIGIAAALYGIFARSVRDLEILVPDHGAADPSSPEGDAASDPGTQEKVSPIVGASLAGAEHEPASLTDVPSTASTVNERREDR